MRAHPFLNPIEAAIIRWLSKSPRIGWIAVKQYGAPVTWVLRDETDPLVPVFEDEDEDDEEPASMLLERLYHSPDAER